MILPAITKFINDTHASIVMADKDTFHIMNYYYKEVRPAVELSVGN